MEAAGWHQHHRIPAFGDWNYNYHDDGAGVNHWPPVTPCFDFASAAMRTSARPAAPQQKSSERSSMPNNARRMRVPAFGEWNHHGGNGDGVGIGSNGGTWPAVMTPFFDLATTPPQEAPKTPGRRRRGGDGFGGAAKMAVTAAEAPQGHVQTRRSKVADSGAYVAAARRRSCFTVDKPVDDDLYGVPPGMMLYGKPPGARKDGCWLRMILRLLGCSSCLSAS